MKVKFNQPNEFCEELTKDADTIERHIVRTTAMYQASNTVGYTGGLHEHR